MSLFSALQVGANSLAANQLGLQVVGNNIANANTPGYIRQTLNLTPSEPQKLGDLSVGLGVHVESITQQIDKFLEERLRNATSDLTNGQTQESTYAQLESIIGELGDTDLSTSLSKFFNSVQDVLNQPDSVSVRNIAVLQGQTLANDFKNLDGRVRTLQEDVNRQLGSSAVEINGLLDKIAQLNVKIVQTEGGSVSKSDAVGLRDDRNETLKQLSSILDIKTNEQETGDITVLLNGEYVVFQGISRHVKTVVEPKDGLNAVELRLEATDAPINSSSGKLAGLVTSRDTILGGFLSQLNDFSRTVINEFNKVYASGQGLTGFSSVASEQAVNNSQAALDQAGLSFTPVNGSFQIKVRNQQTGLTTTKDIQVDLNGIGDDTTLESLASQIDSIDGVTATIDETRHLRISSDSSQTTFSFANDTSGVLASLGINTFFSGTGARDIGINQQLKGDPAKFAASSGGVGEDSKNAETLASLLTTHLDSQGGSSLAVLYDRLTSEVSQGSAVTKSVTDGYKTFQAALDGQHLAISGVSIDEEAVKLVAYQRAFQASAKFISVISEMLDMLVNL